MCPSRLSRKHCGHKRNRVGISARLPAQAVRAACQHVFLESLEGQPLRGIQEPVKYHLLSSGLRRQPTDTKNRYMPEVVRVGTMFFW